MAVCLARVNVDTQACVLVQGQDVPECGVVIDRDDVRVRVTHRQRFGVRVELTFGSPLTYNSFMRVELNLLASG